MNYYVCCPCVTVVVGRHLGVVAIQSWSVVHYCCCPGVGMDAPASTGSLDIGPGQSLHKKQGLAYRTASLQAGKTKQIDVVDYGRIARVHNMFVVVTVAEVHIVIMMCSAGSHHYSPDTSAVSADKVVSSPAGRSDFDPSSTSPAGNTACSMLLVLQCYGNVIEHMYAFCMAKRACL